MDLCSLRWMECTEVYSAQSQLLRESLPLHPCLRRFDVAFKAINAPLPTPNSLYWGFFVLFDPE